MNTEYWGAPSQREADPLHHEKVSAYGIHIYMVNGIKHYQINHTPLTYKIFEIS